METRLEAIPSPTRLWWSQIGKWQTLMVVVTLAAFFVTMDITGDTKNAIAAAAVVAFAFAAAVAAAFASAFAAAAAVVAFAFAAAVAAAFASAFAAAVAVAAVAVIATLIDEIPGVSKKAVWASYTGELLLILLPMLWVLRG